ncbi:hypothetical protein [Schaalia hyovaginalis]|uniref:hypothetical protein n=1 Tax=Schaalia hyovaginalis TaxID=29316 RepID=UPI0026EF1625|nr:hypothetical protein [Schaalia hyovaginalis]MCI6556773.1 hypothetical protein [Schaalia hyovaginalis]MDD7554713.1 hypothetical protein [Schaalia hyovaginalis]MDY3094151.1 hypothetical protein [Schaalia hyovaginalis]
MKNSLLRITLALALTGSSALAACSGSDAPAAQSAASDSAAQGEDAETKADLELARKTILDTLADNPDLDQIYLASDVKKPTEKYGMNAFTRWWKNFSEEHETASQFIVFFILSNGVTVLQLILMPAFKWAFGKTAMVDTAFQFLPIGVSDGQTVHLFDYAVGAIQDGGGGAGLLPRR